MTPATDLPLAVELRPAPDVEVGAGAAGSAAALPAARQRAARSAAGPLFVPDRRSVRVLHGAGRRQRTAWRCLTTQLRHWHGRRVGRTCRRFKAARRGSCPTTWPAAWSACRRRGSTSFSMPALADRPVRHGAGHSTTSSIGPGSSRRAFPKTEPARAAAAGRAADRAVSRAGSTSRRRAPASAPADAGHSGAAELAPQFPRSRPAGPDEQLHGRRLSSRRSAGHRLHPRRRRLSGQPRPAAAVSARAATRCRSICGCGSAIPARSPAGSTWATCKSPAPRPSGSCSVRDGQVEARPIKGTRRRTAWAEADLFAGDELLAKRKGPGRERDDRRSVAERPVARLPSRQRPRHAALRPGNLPVRAAPRLGRRRARSRRARRPIDLVRAAFPGGSITGAPKVRAMEIIAELEPTARGPYCGSLGYFGFDGSLDLSILIRTITAGRGWWQFPVGGGIVAQSSPEREYEETWHKADGPAAGDCV